MVLFAFIVMMFNFFFPQVETTVLREESKDLTGNLQTPGCIKSDSFFVWDVTASLKKLFKV